MLLDCQGLGPTTYGCSLYHIWLQASQCFSTAKAWSLLHTVAASTTYGCSLYHIWLQASQCFSTAKAWSLLLVVLGTTTYALRSRLVCNHVVTTPRGCTRTTCEHRTTACLLTYNLLTTTYALSGRGQPAPEVNMEGSYYRAYNDDGTTPAGWVRHSDGGFVRIRGEEATQSI